MYMYLFQVYKANETELNGLTQVLVTDFHAASKNFIDKVTMIIHCILLLYNVGLTQY